VQRAGAIEVSVLVASNLRRGFKQSRETIDVRGAGVADHKISKAALTPCFQGERQLLRRERTFVQLSWQRPFLEYEDGNMVLPHIVNKVRARRLIKISHPTAEQRELGVLEFR